MRRGGEHTDAPAVHVAGARKRLSERMVVQDEEMILTKVNGRRKRVLSALSVKGEN